MKGSNSGPKSRVAQRLRAARDYYVYVYRGYWTLGAGLLATVVGLVVSLVEGQNWLPAYVGILFSLGILPAGALVLTLIDGLRVRRELKKYEFVSRAVEPRDPGLVSGHSQHQWVRIGAAMAYTSPEINRILDESKAGVVDLGVTGHFELPGELRDMAPGILRGIRTFESKQEKRKKAIRFNGSLARLATELTPETLGQDSEVLLQSVDYFSGECSNEVWGLRSRAVSASEDRHPIEKFVLDSRGGLRPLEQAQVANILGISCLAVTTDDVLLLNVQSPRNSVAPAALSASGSGSLEWSDVAEYSEWGLRAVVRNGMRREVSQECAVPIDCFDRDSFTLTSYFRWANRAFKPELTGSIRLTLSFDQVKRNRLSRAERDFTTDVLGLPLSAVSRHLTSNAEGFWEDDFSPIADDILLSIGDAFPRPPGAWEKAFNPSLVAALLAFRSLGPHSKANH